MQETISQYTLEEMNELVKEVSGGSIADVTTVMYKDVYGNIAVYGTDYSFVVKNVDTSVKLFIHASGFYGTNTLYNEGYNCRLWSSGLTTTITDSTWRFDLDSEHINTCSLDRGDGCTVRLVQD